MRKISSGWRSIGIGWEHMMLPCVEDPCHCVDPRNIGQSKWDQKLDKMECVFPLYDKMRWKQDDVYLLQALLNIYYPSLCAPLLPHYHCTPTVASWKCTWRPGSSNVGDVLGDWDRANSEMPLDAGIKWIGRCTFRSRSSKLSDLHGGHNRVSLEMHLEAEIERTQWCTSRPWSILIGGVLRGGWCAGDWSEHGQSGGSESGGGKLGGMCDGSWDSIHWLTCNCGNVEN